MLQIFANNFLAYLQQQVMLEDTGCVLKLSPDSENAVAFVTPSITYYWVIAVSLQSNKVILHEVIFTSDGAENILDNFLEYDTLALVVERILAEIENYTEE